MNSKSKQSMAVVALTAWAGAAQAAGSGAAYAAMDVVAPAGLNVLAWAPPALLCLGCVAGLARLILADRTWQVVADRKPARHSRVRLRRGSAHHGDTFPI